MLGLDRHDPPHAFGSTHGDSRVTRLAIGEGTHYTPFAQRSHQIWREIERETGETLLTQNGGLILSSPNTRAATHVAGFFPNTVAAAEMFGVVHERLDAAQVRARFPEFAVAEDEYGYYERDAGFVRPESAVRAQLALARKFGAAVRANEPAVAFQASRNDVTVSTRSGTYTADTLIVAAGPWLPQLLAPVLAQQFSVFRQVFYWFDVEGPIAPFLPENFPVFIWELRDSREGIYGFPAIDGPRGGIKIAAEHYGTTTTPQSVRREVTSDEIADMHANYVAPYFPHLSCRCVRTATCLYTVTPDAGFVIDRHPDSERVILASPCSGHGFKHSAALGEALAELTLAGKSQLDLGPFALSRFARQGGHLDSP